MANRQTRDNSQSEWYPTGVASDSSDGQPPMARRSVNGYGDASHSYARYDQYDHGDYSNGYQGYQQAMPTPHRVASRPGAVQTRMPQEPQEDDIEMLETQKYVAPTGRSISYHPTRWALVNSLLDWADDLTGGKAGVLQRLFTYLLIGGTAALVNLGVFALLGHFGSITVKHLPYYLFANIVAYEVSIMANFIPNDYITFRHLEGHSRSWAARCLRFHITSIGGIIVTFVIASTLNGLLGVRFLIAQAIALIIAVFFNFTFHHVFTYRGAKH